MERSTCHATHTPVIKNSSYHYEVTTLTSESLCQRNANLVLTLTSLSRT